ncbi:fluoride efflux transporter FluC [Bacillus sp. SG-1]|uniref:fluoride efflux transporter FluC n=1 Tax=Bacillus sp. SG-1 TaxID=161544 RepID=UPI0001543C8B|nr:CrcB family protein [Bacillus sp. SG-1]EDL66180.1 camphor resistance protein CrcB [Bacillus sp. SG-1]
MTILAIAFGGFIGAVMRFAIGSFIKSRLQSRFPWATLMVNLLGAFLLGILLGAGVEGTSYAFFGIGFLGAFTTYSTFMVEALSLRKAGYKRESLLYLAISYSAGLVAAFLGLVLGIL